MIITGAPANQVIGTLSVDIAVSHKPIATKQGLYNL